MMTKMRSTIKNILLGAVLLAVTMKFQSCSLDEYNPGGFTMEAMSATEEGYQTLVNQCYFAMQRYFYGTDSWMALTEGNTDLWTYQRNMSTS